MINLNKEPSDRVSFKRIIPVLLVTLFLTWIVAYNISLGRQGTEEVESKVQEADTEMESEVPESESGGVTPGERDVTIKEFEFKTHIRGHNDETYQGKNDYPDFDVIVGAIGKDAYGNEIHLDEAEVSRFQTDEIALYLTSDNIGIQIGDTIKVALDEYGEIIYAEK
ncbi:hypothetical protein [Cytobacillus oceanisediminis]|uniref:hypothetical protein n=1 Tax=Cytobacillus oceanisediminis TaxID=665099 RepID=UPI001FB4139C|nr:hypothetical protein [Cytobacillus oceanisediminis]UOE58125.1 hypothetical protein IRB79_26830 [Cytobacillus oceanisediminis]